jgi:hypothetical protein
MQWNDKLCMDTVFELSFFFLDKSPDFIVFAFVGEFQANIFQFAFKSIKPQPECQRHVNVFCFGYDHQLFFPFLGIERAHVVHPVR